MTGLNSEQINTHWRQGNLLWKMHKGQWRIELAYLEAKGKLFVADCSRQLGKTTWCVFKAVETALKKPGSRIRCATAFLTDLEQFIMPAFEFVLSDAPKDIAPVYRAQKTEYLFPNGSRIRLVGLDRKPNGLRGNRLDLVILDECGYISRLGYLYRSVLIPATTHVPDAKIIMASTQPETPDHDFVQFCDKAEQEGGYVKLDVYENPLLDEPTIDVLAKECGGRGSTAFKREYLCERIVEEGRAIIPEFNQVFHVKQSPRCPANKFWHRMESLDSGVRDMTACLFGYYDFARATLCIEGEFAIVGHEVTTRRIAELVKLKETELGYGNVYMRICDNDNLILVQDLGSEFQLHFAPTNKDELHAMVNKVRLWFGSNRIEISPACKKLIASLRAGIWDERRREFSRSEVHGHYDLIAALVYMVRNVPESENPVPHFFMQDLSNVIFGNPKQSGAANTLKKAFMG